MSDGATPTTAGDTSPLTQSPRRRALSSRHLTALAISAVLAACGTVPANDIAFTLFSAAYIHVLSAAAFPPLRLSNDLQVFGAGNRLLGAYSSCALIVGLLLPLAHTLDCAVAGDKDGLGAAAPHMFLVAAQVFFEGVAFAGGFSLPVFAFVPLLYNTKRLFTLVDWIASEFGKVTEGEHRAARREIAGRGLAVANLGFWAFNLFGFLIPIYLPRVFKRYYAGSNNNTKARD